MNAKNASVVSSTIPRLGWADHDLSIYLSVYRKRSAGRFSALGVVRDCEGSAQYSSNPEVVLSRADYAASHPTTRAAVDPTYQE